MTVIPTIPINYIFYGLFAALFTIDYLHNILKIIPKAFTWLPELIALFMCVIIILRIALYKDIKISVQYLILVFCYVLNLLCGIVLNSVPSDAIILGLRDYFLFLPFFLFPLVYEFTDQQIKKQLHFLLILLYFQVPLALYQRLFLFKTTYTGDVVTGTFWGPTPLSLLIIAGICIFYAFYLRNSISLKTFLFASFVLFIPAMINETKATVFLLPAGLISASFLEKSQKPFSKIKNIFFLVFILGLMLTVFTIFYNTFYKDEEKSKGGLLSHLESIYKGKSYLYWGERSEDESNRKVGRIDAIVLAYKELSNDIGTMFFGMGMGNAHSTDISILGEQKIDVNEEYGGERNVISSMLWETGFLGLLLYLVFLFLFLRDTISLKKSDDFFGTFAIGWISIISIMFINLIYKNTFRMNQINLLFFYFSGLVASKAFKFRDVMRKSDTADDLYY